MGNKKYRVIICCAFFISSVTANTELQFQVDPQAITTNAPRLGINLGEWVSWGASQYPLNVLKNPGFEGTIDRAIVIVKSADSNT